MGCDVVWDTESSAPRAARGGAVQIRLVCVPRARVNINLDEHESDATTSLLKSASTSGSIYVAKICDAAIQIVRTRYGTEGNMGGRQAACDQQERQKRD